MITLHAFSFAGWSYFSSLCCFPPHFFPPHPKEISEALLEILTGSEYPYAGVWPATEHWQVDNAAAALPDLDSSEYFPQRVKFRVYRPKGFCVLRELKRKLVIACHLEAWWFRELWWDQWGTWLTFLLTFLLTSQRAGFCLKINAPLHRQQRFFCNESLPEMNSHSFFGMTVVKSLVYNGRFSVAAFIRENFSTSKRNLFFKKKESPLDTESKSISSLLPKNCHGRELYLYLEIHVHRYICLHVWVLGIMDSLLVAGDFLHRRSLTARKRYMRWVGGRAWRLLPNQCSSSWIMEPEDC